MCTYICVYVYLSVCINIDVCVFAYMYVCVRDLPGVNTSNLFSEFLCHDNQFRKINWFVKSTKTIKNIS